ncbi:hypothetical protein HYH03_004672 [Edaphochlamys debaryana]|uniref:Vacuolar protein 8 n=1 Tax=Edaphochlamys debaryana TaxID=47281 RepID=A0A835YH46_9CHLO|nr:hypothetical protein HYH03_004672 [Edaphochlamys debaryana]|eukprot:KAG2497524.1 hypothetical protein HYH03_004672 [Edaphochlamys debaryana]
MQTALATLGSPHKAVTRNLQPSSSPLRQLASPPSRRTPQACAALPFGLPSFGFSSPGPSGNNDSGGSWLRPRSPTGSGGGAGEQSTNTPASSTGSPSPTAQSAVRRRLNLAPLAATAQAAAPAAASPGCEEAERQRRSSDGSGSRRSGVLPRRRRSSGADDEGAGGAEEGSPRREEGGGGLWGLGGLAGSLLGGGGSPGGGLGSPELQAIAKALAEINGGDLFAASIAQNAAAAAAAAAAGEGSSEPGPAALGPALLPALRAQAASRRRALLERLHGGLVGGTLRPREALTVPGLLPFLSDLLLPRATGQSEEAYRPGAVAGLALECLCTLLSDEATPAPQQPLLPFGAPPPPPPAPLAPHLLDQLLPAVRGALGVLRASRLPQVAGAQHAPQPGSPASAAPPLPAPDVTAAGGGWSADVSAAFFAASLLVRAARHPPLAAAAVEGGGLGLLVALMGCRPPMLAQMAVFAAYKLVGRAPPGSASGTGGPAPAPGAHAHAHAPAGPAAEAAARWREGALLAVAEAGGVGALCRVLASAEDRPSRDMASSLLLDMALAGGVPAAVARLGQVAPLVAVLAGGQGQGGAAAGGAGSPRGPDPISRMYALLVLARLANHSPECQMDAVREGAVEPLLALLRRGCEDEQTHACRLLAILAQALPTHGTFKEAGVVAAVLPLLRGERGRGPLVAEHAASVVAVLAQNPDMHFHIVGAGAVPALVPLLSRVSPAKRPPSFPVLPGAAALRSAESESEGTEKARTYALACLMLLAEQEERHAAVVVRAGALPALVALAKAAPAPAPVHGHGSGAGERGGAAAAASPLLPGAAGSGPGSGAVQEFAAAVLCSLSRYTNVQADLVSHGALPALQRCLGSAASPSSGPTAASTALHAAEALVHLAAGDAAAKRCLGRDDDAAAALLRLLTGAKPAGRYWGLQLLRLLATDDEALEAVAGAAPPLHHHHHEPPSAAAQLGWQPPPLVLLPRRTSTSPRSPAPPPSATPASASASAPAPAPAAAPAPPRPALLGAFTMLTGAAEGHEPIDAHHCHDDEEAEGGAEGAHGAEPLGLPLQLAAMALGRPGPSSLTAAYAAALAAASGGDAAAPAAGPREAAPGLAHPSRALELVGALVGLLGPAWAPLPPSWQAGRCRVLAAWLLARSCDCAPLAPAVVASGAVRALAGMLAEEQRRQRGLGHHHARSGSLGLAGAGAADGGEEGPGAGGNGYSGASAGSGLGAGGGSQAALGPVEAEWMAAMGAAAAPGGGAGLSARRARFDGNGAAAAEAALAAVARLGGGGRRSVLCELALQQWLGAGVVVRGLEGEQD